jgi:hypothetical protein
MYTMRSNVEPPGDSDARCEKGRESERGSSEVAEGENARRRSGSVKHRYKDGPELI